MFLQDSLSAPRMDARTSSRPSLPGPSSQTLTRFKPFDNITPSHLIAIAVVDCIEQIENSRKASDDLNRDRALKALQILPVLFTRLPPDSQTNHARVIALRTQQWVGGNFALLIADYLSDCRTMYALMGVSPMEAAARIKKQLIDTIGTIAARGHAQLLLARLSALAPIAAQRGNTTNSNQQIISLNALARAHYRRSIGTCGGAQMYALMGVSPMEAAARIKKQLIDTIGTIAARGHAQLLLARLSALAPIAAQRGNTTNSNQQIISLNALARAHYRRSIGTRGGAQASAAD
ncbi:hypothetical protein T492DRAFT_871776 [Pavlovales sp. CCMP2436]|nr:hypothetical protein T492DRAFT_871776 [Pavlovales sp. CCMP2436]